VLPCVRYEMSPMSQVAHAAILTFPLSGNISEKTNLPTICQHYDWPDGTALGALRPFRVKAAERFHRLGYVEKARVSPLRRWRVVQDDAGRVRTRKAFIASFRRGGSSVD